MAKTNPELFAKTVLWQLAVLRAEIYETKLHLISLRSAAKGRTARSLQDEWKEQTEQSIQDWYRASCEASNIPPDPLPPIEDRGWGHRSG